MIQPFPQFASWLWTEASATPDGTGRFVCFRHVFTVDGEPESARLRITADSRYELFVNGEWLGHGPARSWPDPWPVDEYIVSPPLRPGRNVIAVLVHHFGVGTFQYLPESAGIVAALRWSDSAGGHELGTDADWRCRIHAGFDQLVPRACCQQGWEEHFDARRFPADWAQADFDDQSWEPATVLRPAGSGPHACFEMRDVPFLTRTPLLPTRFVSLEAVRPADSHWAIDPRTVINANDHSANMIKARLMVFTRIHSDCRQAIALHQFIYSGGFEWKLNGTLLEFTDAAMLKTDSGVAHSWLEAGWNTLLVSYPEIFHFGLLAVSAWHESKIRLEAMPGQEWVALGPFAQPPPNGTPSQLENYYCTPPFIEPDRIAATATWCRHQEIWERGSPANPDLSEFAHGLPTMTSVAALCATERVLPHTPVVMHAADALLGETSEWSIIEPPASGADARVLLDFGCETIGFQELELDAKAGVVIDVHNFEFIQQDGRINLTEGMANGFRYVCRDGQQTVRSFVRRGFRYMWISLRKFSEPVRLRRVRVLESTCPQTGSGHFACSDPLLTRIWEVAVRSVACCSEDTYTDCPSYEQTHWVGDARNEALVDLIANGDPRLSRHSWLQAARSLERSPLVESHIPSAWENIIPAWSFLWMRWAEEHHRLTGDAEFARSALPWLDRNAAGIRRYLNRYGLFEIRAWNMFDWAPMDTPTTGVVTHQNCLAVLALRQTAQLADHLGDMARRDAWVQLADELASAINRHLWDDSRQAYVDCVRADGSASQVFSQQTQTTAFIAKVATGERALRCREIISAPPAGFVAAGSPFFMFFLLEVLSAEQQFEELAASIRDYWGVQIAAGATTFWETYHPQNARITRSHCHGWSAAPAFFLSHDILGVQPLKPGFSEVRVAPRGDLAWCAGRTPTPAGVIKCRWEKSEGSLRLELHLPVALPVLIDLDRNGELVLEQGNVRVLSSESDRLQLVASNCRDLVLRLLPHQPATPTDP